MRIIQNANYCALFLLTAISVSGCDGSVTKEQTRNTTEEFTCSAAMQYRRYGGFEFFVECPDVNFALSPDEEQKVRQSVGDTLKAQTYRCTRIKHVGITTGSTHYSDQRCELLPRRS